MNKTNSEDNFDTKKEIQQLKDGFEPHNLSTRICQAIKSQKDIDIVLKEVVKEALQNDISVQKILKNLIIETAKENNFISWKVAMSWILTLILSVISGGYFIK